MGHETDIDSLVARIQDLTAAVKKTSSTACSSACGGDGKANPIMPETGCINQGMAKCSYLLEQQRCEGYQI